MSVGCTKSQINLLRRGALSTPNSAGFFSNMRRKKLSCLAAELFQESIMFLSVVFVTHGLMERDNSTISKVYFFKVTPASEV